MWTDAVVEADGTVASIRRCFGVIGVILLRAQLHLQVDGEICDGLTCRTI